MNVHIVSLVALASLLAACGDDKKPATKPPAQPPGAQNMPADHGAAMDLGTLTVAGKQFGIVRLGDLVPGKEGAFEVHPKGIAAAEMATLNVYLWLESQDGTQLSAPAKGSPDGAALHFHVTPRAGESKPFRAVLRLRADGVDERASLPHVAQTSPLT